MDRVVHFEMPYDDPDRLSKFYKEAFGWGMQNLGSAMGGYVLATTTETDNRGPKKPGAINGGFFAKDPQWPPHTSVVIEVDNLAASMKKVQSAGGQILGEPMEIPGIGNYVAITDSEGNRVGVLQPPPRPAAAAPGKAAARKRAPARKKKAPARKSSARKKR
jgi:predicted enzyme related to lactoylglutathione lyase